MKVKYLPINGKEYPLCFSTRVLMALEDKAGDADAELNRIFAEHKISDLFWLLTQMLDAGQRYAVLEELDAPVPPTYDQLLDLIGVEDYEAMFAHLTSAVKEDSAPTVETAPAKNAEATPDE